MPAGRGAGPGGGVGPPAAPASGTTGHTRCSQGEGGAMATGTDAARGAPEPDELRAEFLLRPDVVFLNHGSFGACPRPVFEEYQRWQLELERQPVAFFSRRTELMPQARAAPA